jgi:Flp pilus assembly protein TadG
MVMGMVKGKLLLRGWRQRDEDGESGQALVELAISLSLLLLLMLGAVEFAQIAYAAIEVSNAANAGSSWGSMKSSYASDATGIANAAANDATMSGLTNFTTTSSVSCQCSDGTVINCATDNNSCTGTHAEATVTVNTSASFNPLIHIPGLANTITLTGQSIRKCGGD